MFSFCLANESQGGFIWKKIPMAQHEKLPDIFRVSRSFRTFSGLHLLCRLCRIGAFPRKYILAMVWFQTQHYVLMQLNQSVPCVCVVTDHLALGIRWGITPFRCIGLEAYWMKEREAKKGKREYQQCNLLTYARLVVGFPYIGNPFIFLLC